MESSDFTRLDYKTINGFFPKGQLSILAAGPGVGKTVFATQIANQFCRHGENTLYFCLEYDSIVIINHLGTLEAMEIDYYKPAVKCARSRILSGKLK